MAPASPSERQKTGADARSSPDAEDPHAFVIKDEEEVLQISQTIQRCGDIETSRKCIVLRQSDHAEVEEPQPVKVEDSTPLVGGDGGESAILGECLTKFVEQVTAQMFQNPFLRHSTDCIMTVICAESMKSLEVKFQSHVESTGGLKKNRQFVKDMGPIMEVAARKEEGRVGWWLEDSLGVLAEGICLLRTVREECSGDEDVSDHVRVKLTTLVEDAEDFFWEILKMGVADLDEDSVMPHNEWESNVLEYFKDKENLSNIVCEFALMSAKRKARNEFSHPFGDHVNLEVRVTTLDLLTRMIEDPFCGAFRHVASLSRYSLLLDHFKGKPRTGHGSRISKVVSKMEKLAESDDVFGFEF